MGGAVAQGNQAFQPDQEAKREVKAAENKAGHCSHDFNTTMQKVEAGELLKVSG